VFLALNMNRIAGVILVLLAFCVFSCQKVEELLPFEYPGMLANRIGQVSVLEDGTLLAIGVDGIFVRYPDNSTSVVSVNSSETDLNAAYGMKFLKGDNVIYGVNVFYVLVIRNDGYQFYSSDFGSNSPLSYPEYTITPDNELLKLSYGESRFNQELNRFERPIRISRWNFSGWDFADSEIYISDNNSSSSLTMVFQTDYRAYLWIDKLYEIGYNEYDDIDFEEIIPINGDISSNKIYSASPYDKEIVGFDREINEYTGANSLNINRSIIFNTSTGELSGSAPSDNCGVVPFGSLNFDQYLGRHGSIAYFYTNIVFNQFSTEYKRGEVYAYNMSDGTCSFNAILAKGPLRELDIQIIDLDIDVRNELLYIGTNHGLFIYDRQNHSVQSYLENLRDDNYN